MNRHYIVIKIIEVTLFIELLVSSCFSSNLFAQESNPVSFRHVKGIQGMEFSAGISDLGWAGCIYYTNCFSNRWYGKTGLTYEFINDPRFKSWALTADIAAARTLISRRSIFINVIAGGSAVIHESVEGFVIENKIQPVGYGLMCGGEIEYFLSNRFVLIGDGILRYIFNSDIGKQRFYGTIGLKYIF